MTTETTLYAALVAAGCEIDHHESDLYFEPTDTAIAILDQFPDQKRMSAKFFNERMQESGNPFWVEVPFAYTPFWEKK